MRGAEDNAVADRVARKQIMSGRPKRGMLAHKRHSSRWINEMNTGAFTPSTRVYAG